MTLFSLVIPAGAEKTAKVFRLDHRIGIVLNLLDTNNFDDILLHPSVNDGALWTGAS